MRELPNLAGPQEPHASFSAIGRFTRTLDIQSENSLDRVSSLLGKAHRDKEQDRES